MNSKNYTRSRVLSPLFSKYLLFGVFVCLCFSLRANVLTLSCPDDLEVQLEPAQCEVSVPFDTLVWSSTEVLTDTVFFPPSGTFFGIGNNVVTLAVTDIGGNLETCTFNVLVQEFLSSEVICQSNIELSLNGECSRSMFPSEILDPDSLGCIENYEMIRLSAGGIALPPVISASDVNATFLVAVTHIGNGMQCVTQVTVTGGTPSSITCPANISISCNEPPDTSITGQPTLTGCYQNVELAYFDEQISTSCPDSVAFQITRTWVSTDPFGKKDTCTQLITAYRFDIDLVDFPGDFDGTIYPPLHCSDTLTLEELTDPEVTGQPSFINFPASNSPDCKVTTTFTDFVTNLCGGNYEIERVWTVVKICSPPQTRRDTQLIQVIDTLGPQFEIPDTIFISLSNECADSLELPPAENIRECSSYTIEIRTPWDTLTTNGGWTNVVISPGSHSVIYELEDLCGNISTDTAVLFLENETLVSCPPDLTVDCNYYFDTLVAAIILGNTTILHQLGTPTFHANCSFGFTEVDSIVVNSCGIGSVYRSMVSNGNSPQECLQEIHVEHVSNFEASFPKDTSICVPLATVNTGIPLISGADCENVSFIGIDNLIPGDVPDCFTLERRWLVTNSCNYNGINSFDDTQVGPRQYADGGDGIIEYTQIIEVNNSSGPLFPELCEIPDLYVANGSCEATLELPTPTVLGCGNVDLFVAGALGAELGAEVSIGVGMHGVNYTAIDDCGRVSTCNTFFEVIDTIPPQFECLPQIIEFPSSATFITFFASDIAQNGMDNCGNPIYYSFSEDIEDIDTTFDCCALGQHILEIWATDEFGNQSSCQTFVVLQDNFNFCDCDPFVAGTIMTEEMEGIANVDVEVSSNPPSINFDIPTDIAGSFSAYIPFGFDYTFTPSKNINPLNGVSTFDALIITKHILNIEQLDTPYKLIAADFNNSGSITTFDLLEIRKLILNITTEIPNNTSWRFVPSDFEFPNPQDPFSSGWPELIEINNINEAELELDFIGIKVGDVNGSADTQD